MVDQNLFFITDSLEKFLSASQLFIVKANFWDCCQMWETCYQTSSIYELQYFRAFLGQR